METNLTSLGLKDLTRLLTEAERELEQSLIEGASWQEVKTNVDMITEINIEIYKKQCASTSGSPADTPFR